MTGRGGSPGTSAGSRNASPRARRRRTPRRSSRGAKRSRGWAPVDEGACPPWIRRSQRARGQGDRPPRHRRSQRARGQGDRLAGGQRAPRPRGMRRRAPRQRERGRAAPGRRGRRPPSHSLRRQSPPLPALPGRSASLACAKAKARARARARALHPTLLSHSRLPRPLPSRTWTSVARGKTTCGPTDIYVHPCIERTHPFIVACCCPSPSFRSVRQRSAGTGRPWTRAGSRGT